MINDFLGQWRLLEFYFQSADNSKYYPFGKNTQGLLIYTENKVSAQLGNIEINNFLSDDFRIGSSEEIINRFNNFISYFGTYKINVNENCITHIIEQSLFPNWINQKVKRYYEFTDNFLILRATPILHNNQLINPTLTWEREK